MKLRAIPAATAPKGHFYHRTSRVRQTIAEMVQSGRCPACNKPWDDHPTKTCSRHLVNR